MTINLDYIKYDEESTEKALSLKKDVEKLIDKIETLILPSRSRSLSLTKLEECYMWIGKSIRDDQIARGSQPEDIPERTNL